MKTLITLKKLLIAILLIISVNNIKAQCTANFTYSVGLNGNVTFTSTSIGTTSNTQYYWSFGDGNNFWGINVPVISHAYQYNDVYTVNLSILDSLVTPFCNSYITNTLTLNTASCGGSPSFTYYVGGNGNVWFSNTSTGVSPNASYTVNWGDGTVGNALGLHTYTAGGLYNVTFSCTDPLSICSYTAAQIVNVTIMSCSLTAGFTYTAGGGGLFNFTSTSTGTTANTNYLWNFGDGTVGGGTNPSHTYTSNGIYTVTLNTSDSIMFWCYGSASQNINLNAPCMANVNFTMAKDSSFIPLIVWNAYPNYPGNIIAANWAWGDGSNTPALYPSHTYSAAGFYNICVTITVSCGSTTTSCSNNNIYRANASAGANSIAKVNVKNLMPTAIKNNLKEENIHISLFPNPNNGEFEFKINGLSEKSAEIKIYNIFAIEIYRSIEVIVNGELIKKINLSELSNGTYFVKIISGNENCNKKLIINK